MHCKPREVRLKLPSLGKFVFVLNMRRTSLAAMFEIAATSASPFIVGSRLQR
jgi:hypothetical protein